VLQKKDVVIWYQNVLEKDVKNNSKKCHWRGPKRCKSFSYKCKLQRYKNKKFKTQCCKKSKVCEGKKCKSKNVWCKWKGLSHHYKDKKTCQMLTIKSHKFLIVKRKRCSLWRKKCIQRRGCKTIKRKSFWEGKKIIIRKLRKCIVKDFSKKYRRTHCCRFTRICKGKKSCKDIGTHCYWTGKKIYKLTGFLRWKVICRDIPFGKQKNIRLNCCKIKQRCVNDGPVYKCENIKKSHCWWRGGIRGDVWIQDSNGQWQEVNAVGSFRYLNDKRNGVKVDTQFTQFGSGSITTGIVIKARKHIIKTSHGKVYLNGKKISRKNHNLKIQFVGKHAKVIVSKKNHIEQ